VGHLTPAAEPSAGFVGIVCGLEAEAACLERALRRGRDRLDALRHREPKAWRSRAARSEQAAPGLLRLRLAMTRDRVAGGHGGRQYVPTRSAERDRHDGEGRAPAPAAAVRVAISGARPDAAERAAERFVAEGARLIVSFGIAGALDPTLRAGDIVLASHVADGEASYPCVRLAGQGRAVWREGPVLGSDRLIGDPAEKARLARGGALAVDMESHRVARAAAAGGIPVAVLRAVSDTSLQRLPAFVAGAVRPDGTPRLAPILAGLARNPRALGDLVALHHGTRAALRALAASADDMLAASRAHV
jgi:nucleoside phosphorylase